MDVAVDVKRRQRRRRRTSSSVDVGHQRSKKSDIGFYPARFWPLGRKIKIEKLIDRIGSDICSYFFLLHVEMLKFLLADVNIILKCGVCLRGPLA